MVFDRKSLCIIRDELPNCGMPGKLGRVGSSYEPINTLTRVTSTTIGLMYGFTYVFSFIIYLYITSTFAVLVCLLFITSTTYMPLLFTAMVVITPAGSVWLTTLPYIS